MTPVCIAGMHRSGTSMIARVLNLCGLYLGEPKDLLPPAPDNPEGFWENSQFVSINEALLTKLGGGWDAPPISPKGWESDPGLLAYYQRGTELIGQFEGHEPWGWKDPRNSVLLEFWRRLLPELQVVICLRNPLAVAQSLTRRGFSSPAFGMNLWYSNYNRLLNAIPVERRIVTHYDSFFIDPRAELRRLLGFLKIPASEEALEKALTAIAVPLKHHAPNLFDLLDQKPPLELIELYQKLCAEAGPVYAAQAGFEALAPVLSPDTYSRYLDIRQKDRLTDEVKSLSTQVAQKEILMSERETVLAAVQAELDAQKATPGWKMLERYRAWKLRMLPPGSRRERFVLFPPRLLRVWRNEGFKGISDRIATRQARYRAAIGLTPAHEAPAAEPQASIVIPVFNSVALTKECLDSVYRNTQHLAFEIIVIDNASSDETPVWLQAEKERRANLEVVRMAENVGFGPAVNIGIQKSKADLIVILNNDTLVAPGWLDDLVAVVQKDPSVGIVSPVTNYVGEGPQIDPAATALPPDLEAIEQYAAGIQDRREPCYEPNRLVFFCVLVRRGVVDRIGLLDPGYERGNYEDDDYCLRARMAGYRLAIARNSFVYHRGSATFTASKISHSQYMEQNRDRFYRKTGRISTSTYQIGTGISPRRHLVSVIVRTVNRPVLLQKALNSLANQTFRDFEVVVVNDGGEDVSSLLEPLDGPLTITYARSQTAKGRSAALDMGLEHSRGSWITYLDDDDIVYPWHLEVLVQGAEASGGKFVYSDYNRALFLGADPVNPTKLVGAPPWDFMRSQLLVQNYIPIHTWLHARSCVEDVGGWDHELDRLEDYDFLLKLSTKHQFQHVRKVTCEYRYYLHSTNSIYTERGRTLSALKRIYERYPVQDQQLLARRRATIADLEAQVTAIEELEKRVGETLTEAQMTREVIRLVLNL